MKIHSDLHIHSTLSSCCHDPDQTLENIVSVMHGKGFKKIGICDHFWRNPAVKPNGFYAPQTGDPILVLKKKAEKMDFPIRVLIGAETEMIAPGVFGVDRAFKEQVDFIALPTDHFHITDFVKQPLDATPRGIAVHLLEFFISGAKSGLADILVHPFLPLGKSMWQYDRIMESVSDAELFDAWSIAAENHVAVEINAACLFCGEYAKLFSRDTIRRTHELAKKAGCKFTVGSDSHELGKFAGYEEVAAFCDEVGITEKDFSPLMF